MFCLYFEAVRGFIRGSMLTYTFSFSCTDFGISLLCSSIFLYVCCFALLQTKEPSWSTVVTNEQNAHQDDLSENSGSVQSKWVADYRCFLSVINFATLWAILLLFIDVRYVAQLNPLIQTNIYKYLSTYLKTIIPHKLIQKLNNDCERNQNLKWNALHIT